MEIELVLERETKNTYRFREVEGDMPPAVGTLYLQKWATKSLNGGDVPRRIRVTVEAVE